MTIAQGTRFALTIDRIAAGGESVGKAPDGRVVFVDAGLPGDELLVEVSQAKERMLRADLVEVVRLAEREREPGETCAVADRCGGCRFWGCSYEEELRLKVEATVGSVQRIAREVVWPAPAVTPSQAVRGYRSRARLRVERDGSTGFLARQSATTVVTEVCPVLRPELDAARRELKPILAGLAGIEAVFVEVDEQRDGSAATIELVPGDHTDLVRKIRDRAALAKPLYHLSTISIANGRTQLPVIGDGKVMRRRGLADGVVVADAPAAFSQANAELNQALVEAVCEASGQPSSNAGRMLELYCGSGNFTFAAAELGWSVDAVEGAAPAIAAATAARQKSRFADRLRFFVSDLNTGLPDPIRSDRDRYAVVLADPPRGGMPKPLIGFIGSTSARRVVYVSCDPPAFARDAGLLAVHGFRVARWHLVDMYARTPHLEIVAELVR